MNMSISSRVLNNRYVILIFALICAPLSCLLLDVDTTATRTDGIMQHLFSFLFIVFLAFQIRKTLNIETEIVRSENVSILQRAIAFGIDYYIYFFGIFPLIAVLSNLTTALLHWDFSYCYLWRGLHEINRTLDIRDIIASTISCLLIFLSLITLFALPINKDSQSIGQYALGIKYVHEYEPITFGQSIKWVIYSFLGVAAWPLNLIYYMRNGCMWQDSQCFVYPVAIIKKLNINAEG